MATKSKKQVTKTVAKKATPAKAKKQAAKALAKAKAQPKAAPAKAEPKVKAAPQAKTPVAKPVNPKEAALVAGITNLEALRAQCKLTNAKRLHLRKLKRQLKRLRRKLAAEAKAAKVAAKTAAKPSKAVAEANAAIAEAEAVIAEIEAKPAKPTKAMRAATRLAEEIVMGTLTPTKTLGHGALTLAFVNEALVVAIGDHGAMIDRHEVLALYTWLRAHCDSHVVGGKGK